MVAIIFVKNDQLRNGGHFKIEPPKYRGAICDQTVSLIKLVKKTDPHYFLILEGVYFLPFFSYSSFCHKWRPDFRGPNF